MPHLKHCRHFFTLSLICSIALFSCRKKDEKYEGIYVGTENYNELDSGATILSIDSTYHQEIVVTYDKKIYTFLKLFDNPSNQISQLHRQSIVDHEYYGMEGGYIKFSGDSMYLEAGTLEDNGDMKGLFFQGKRN